VETRNRKGRRTDGALPASHHTGLVKRILIATDGSRSAREAAEFGLELAREHGAEVTFVHVAAPPPGYDESFGPAGAPRTWPEPEDYAPLRAAEKLAAAQGVAAQALLLAGDTTEEIVACADTLDADLIVVGSRGLGPVKTALLGSVSRGVLHGTSRPVLVVRAPGSVPARTLANAL